MTISPECPLQSRVCADAWLKPSKRWKEWGTIKVLPGLASAKEQTLFIASGAHFTCVHLDSEWLEQQLDVCGEDLCCIFCNGWHT